MADDLQFDKVEYTAAPTCASCSGPLGSPWWQAGPARFCANCKAGIEAHLGAPISAGTQLKAVAAGLGTALACAIGWALIRETTGYELGIVAIAVGWAIAEVMRRVAGRGTRLLQVVAVGLVYLSVALSSIPAVLAEMEEPGVGSLLLAIVLSFALPFLVWMEGISAFLWYLIVFFGLQRAWVGLTPVRVEFQGPHTT